MKRITLALVAAMSSAAASSASMLEAELTKKLPSVFARAAEHYRALDAAASLCITNAKGVCCLPRGFKRDTRTLNMKPTQEWTAGHYPGSLWFLYEATGDAFFRERALCWTEMLTSISKFEGNHDIGFMMNCSFGNARRVLKTNRYDALLAEAAQTLCLRYNDKLGLIRSWGRRDEKKNFLVIPDNLMNLELLELASRLGKTRNAKRFDTIARSHADMTMAHHFRPDGGCRHVVDYDQQTCRVQAILRGQGASCETAWSRGESWAVYGYVMMYRMTGLRRYFDFACKLAEYCLNHPNMPEDGIPYWDYGAPGEERDTSAGAILASALMELSQYVDAPTRARYRGFAVKQLLALSSPAYFSQGDEIGHFLLKHGVGHKPGKSEVDTPLNYGDYYYLEALLRFRTILAREEANADVRAKLPTTPSLPPDELTLRRRGKALAPDVLRREADRAEAEHMPETLDSLYEEFWQTGNRTHYQVPFFNRLKNLDDLTLAEAAEGKGRRLPRIAEYIRAICAMKSWVLPAHDNADGSRGNLRGTCQTVDLVSSEVAARLACVVQILGARLDPALVRLIRAESERRVFAPLRREVYMHQGGDKSDGALRLHWWISTFNNWNAVCWDNVVCAALGLLADPEDRAFFVASACRAIPAYLSGFTPDGYCSEGMGYWNYGYGHHLMMGRLLRRVSQGRLDIFTEPIQRTVAAYPRAYTLCPGVSPAFADGCGPVDRRYLALVDEIWPDLPKVNPPVSAFPDAMVWLVRDTNGLNVAFKGGHNGEMHNHNDVGSYYVTQGNRFMAGDPGGEEYTRFTFSGARYKSKILNSYGHPVPRIGGQLQSTGRAFAARVVSTDLNVTNTTVTLELKDAYKVPSLKSCLRTFTYDRGRKTFFVRDHIVFTEPTSLEIPYMTYCPEANPSKRLIVWNVRPTVAVKGGEYALEEEDIPNPNRIAPRRVAVRFKQDVLEAEVEMTYAALPPDEKK